MPVLIAVCLVVAAITLVMPSTPTYDPWAWIMWGREIAHLDLVTEGGPSWKPLPVLFTTLFSVFGDDVAPYLWLVVARAGGLLACVMSFRIARRLIGGGWYGLLAGVFAALALFSSFKFVRDAALGNSEPLLAALVLWAFERHLDGRRDHALYLGVAGALLRPEVWPFLGLYGLWLWFAEPRLRARMVAFAVARPGALVPARVVGLGRPVPGGRAREQPQSGQRCLRRPPGARAGQPLPQVVIAPVKVGIIIGFVYASVMWVRRRREGRTLASGWLGFAWFALVAAMTEAGFAGNQRYLIVTTADVCVLGGLGAARVLQGVGWVGERVFGDGAPGPHRRGRVLRLPRRCSPRSSSRRPTTPAASSGGLRHEAQLWHDLKGLIDEAGGRERLVACGGVYSGPFQTQMVAFELHIHGIQVGWKVTPRAGRAVPHPDRARRAARGQAHRRPLPAGGHQRQVAPPHRAAGTGGAACPRAGRDAPARRPRSAARPRGRPHAPSCGHH